RISSLCERSDGSTFRAARRFRPSSSSASQTTPMPPSPSCDCRRKPPMTSPIFNRTASGAMPNSYTSFRLTALVDGREQRLEVEAAERFDHVGIEELVGTAADLGGRTLRVPRLGIGARVRERVEVVRDDDDAAGDRD